MKKHPHTISESFKKNRLLIPIETITIIEQHHEQPAEYNFESREEIIHGILENYRSSKMVEKALDALTQVVN